MRNSKATQRSKGRLKTVKKEGSGRYENEGYEDRVGQRAWRQKENDQRVDNHRPQTGQLRRFNSPSPVPQNRNRRNSRKLKTRSSPSPRTPRQAHYLQKLPQNSNFRKKPKNEFEPKIAKIGYLESSKKKKNQVSLIKSQPNTSERSQISSGQRTTLKNKRAKKDQRSNKSPRSVRTKQPDPVSLQFRKEFISPTEVLIQNLGKYQGDLKNLKAEGKGTLTLHSGARYTGNWSNDALNGPGSEYKENGIEYHGDFLEGLKHGKGKAIWPDGSSYEGDWEYGLIQGFGLYIWPDGSSYEGKWKNEERNGHGVYLVKGGVRYEGEFKHDRINGFGKLKMPDGRVFEGGFLDGLQHGEGKLFCYGGGVVVNGRWVSGRLVEQY